MGSSAVLLVEDNDINRDMLTRRLTRAGLTVVTAADHEVRRTDEIALAVSQIN